MINSKVDSYNISTILGGVERAPDRGRSAGTFGDFIAKKKGKAAQKIRKSQIKK